MAKRKEFSLVVSLEYSFDRLLHVKLQQAYEALVPDLVRLRSVSLTKERYHEVRSDLRKSVLQQTEGGEHNSEPDSSAASICSTPRLHRSRRMGSRRRGL